MNTRAQMKPMLGDYSDRDGTIEFFLRIRQALRETDIVLDLGAGRGAWYFEDTCKIRRDIRDIRPHVNSYIGADVDPVILTNPTTTENRHITSDQIPAENEEFDAVICDYVLEHVINAKAFCKEIDRILKPGGFFFARTPHKFQYTSIAARTIKNSQHVSVLNRAQPDRKAEDVFPTAYQLNTSSALKRHFENYKDFSYLYTSEPAYHFGNSAVYKTFEIFHKLLPKPLTSNIFVFMKKPER